jgi:hypothetical protein
MLWPEVELGRKLGGDSVPQYFASNHGWEFAIVIPHHNILFHAYPGKKKLEDDEKSSYVEYAHSISHT